MYAEHTLSHTHMRTHMHTQQQPRATPSIRKNPSHQTVIPSAFPFISRQWFPNPPLMLHHRCCLPHDITDFPWAIDQSVLCACTRECHTHQHSASQPGDGGRREIKADLHNGQAINTKQISPSPFSNPCYFIGNKSKICTLPPGGLALGFNTRSKYQPIKLNTFYVAKYIALVHR